jgi:hypothetical protein
MNEGHFDYQSVSEEKEELDFDRLVPCPHCKKPIPRDATICLYCGGDVIYRHKSPWFIALAVFIILVFIIFLLKSA